MLVRRTLAGHKEVTMHKRDLVTLDLCEGLLADIATNCDQIMVEAEKGRAAIHIVLSYLRAPKPAKGEKKADPLK